MNSYRRSYSPLTPTSSQPETLSRERTNKSAAGDPITDSYGDVGRKSSTLKAPSVSKPYVRTRSPSTSLLPSQEASKELKLLPTPDIEDRLKHTILI